MKVKLCIDQVHYTAKPQKDDAARISATIAGNVQEVTLEELAAVINNGQTTCPTVFFTPHKAQDNFKEQQIFALDFDSGISLPDALKRCEKYNIQPALYYETFSSIAFNRFRFLFCHCTSISSAEAAKTIQLALLSIFPEADSTSKDITKMYYGGKNVHFTVRTFDAHTLLINLINYFADNDQNDHLQRILRGFSRRSGLILENGVFKTELSAAESIGTSPPPVQEKEGGIRASSIYIYMDSAMNTPLLMTFFFDSKPNYSNKEEKVPTASAAEQRQTKKSVRDVDFHKLSERCPLYKALESGTRWLEHSELFGLITNFIHIQGGRSALLDAAGLHPDWYEQKLPDIRRTLDYTSRNGYKPMSCDNFRCPYRDTCSHGATLLETIKPSHNSMTRVRDQDIEFVSMDEAYEDFKNRFNEVMSNCRAGISVIRAQTGIGKTKTYLDYLKFCDTPCLVAVPTNRLKEEVYEKARSMGLNVMMTPSIEDIRMQLPGTKNWLDHLYAIGNEEAVNAFLREYARKNGAQLINKYFRELDATYNFDGTIITTHAKLLHMKRDLLLDRTVIIDEDIINSLYRIETVPLGSIRYFMNVCHPSGIIKPKLNHLLGKCNEDSLYFQDESLSFDLKERLDFFKNIEKMKFGMSSNILGLCESKSFYFDGKTRQVHYIREQKLPAGGRFVILSATADQTIYEKAFTVSLVSFYQCKEAKYAGRVIQYHDKTYSRTSIENIPGFYEELREKHKGCPIITFKDYDPLAAEDDLHIGATEGHNDYEGKDIVVAGTPHKPEFVAKLLGLNLGIVIDDTLSQREIERNGYRFHFMTYGTPELRAIQLWIIESELEQCIGRARLLRHPATVYLYSNLPVRQSTPDGDSSNISAETNEKFQTA